jgi:ABC-type uncharacterized transport system permease subunit
MILHSAHAFGSVSALIALIAYALAAFLSRRLSFSGSRKILILACASHGLSVFASIISTDGAPQFGFAPALSATAWMVVLVYLLEYRWYPQLKTRWGMYVLGGIALLLAVLFPGQPLHVNASPWLPLHWVLGMASYGLFGAAVIHAWLMNRAEQEIRMAAENPTGLPLLTLERLTFRFIISGFVLLTATLLAGFIFGEVLYDAQRSFKWDHKTVFSTMAWITFAILLWGRWRNGWRGRQASRFLYLGALLLLLSYAGSRFVMEVILDRAS